MAPAAPLAPDEVSPGSSDLASTGLTTLSSAQVAVDFPYTKILCFGDSITFGVTLRASQLPPGAQAELAVIEGYVPKLWRRLEERYGTGIELVNAGLGGETSSEGVERIRYEMSVHDPDLVLLLEGIVDVNNSAPRYPVVRSNVAGMMELALRQGRGVIVGTYPLLDTNGFRGNGAENVPRLNDVIRQEANKLSVPIADHEETAPGRSQRTRPRRSPSERHRLRRDGGHVVRDDRGARRRPQRSEWAHPRPRISVG